MRSRIGKYAVEFSSAAVSLIQVNKALRVLRGPIPTIAQLDMAQN
jgi:hypothetical protein